MVHPSTKSVPPAPPSTTTTTTKFWLALGHRLPAPHGFKDLVHTIRWFMERKGLTALRHHDTALTYTGQFRHITPRTYTRIMTKHLPATPPSRIDYHRPSQLLLVTLRGELHTRIIHAACEAIPRLLRDQGFYDDGAITAMHSLDGKTRHGGDGDMPFLDPDCSVKVDGMKAPFVYVEVDSSDVDNTFSRRCGRLKAHTLLLGRNGLPRPRFVVVVNLVRKTRGKGDKASPYEERYPYVSVRVAVLATKERPVPGTDRVKMEVVPVVKTVEVWPRVPGTEEAWRFTWEEMRVNCYPGRMRDRVFVVDWRWLHECVAAFERHSEACGCAGCK
ncbi:uncharacterized protein H6S33_003867 [Morchella sextelata]|uniref:uncharacterized protein n=1 Tax=Morchella sextelata TaxID=1174677 RepID=UPI001D03708B|nr:uncharacterized protein H6S33_003867 [Morchella sextelata]KAH0606206.1 hypothetical protein H6S33_003867 [Morchella sextelata]